MKQILITIIISFAFIFGGLQMANAQCITVDEDAFMAGDICATEGMPNVGPVTTNMLDVWDATTGAAGTDGVADLQLCYEAKIFNPNANGTCNDGDFVIAASWGGSSLNCGSQTGNSDFGASTSDDCVDEHGIIIMTVKFINGFGSEAGTFMFDATSQNGSSEGYEYGFGFVSAATDANGVPITGLNTQAAVCAALATYGNTQYAGGTTASMHGLTPGAPGAFATQADDLNATANNCATSGQNGEDTGSGSGPNSTLGTGVSGLAANDIITEVTYIYGFSNSVGTDCDGDGDTGVGTNPSGSFAGMDICPPPPACGYTITAADFTFNESCGEYTIDFTNLVGVGAADPVTTAAYDVCVNGAPVLTNVTGAAQTGIGPFTADGMAVSVEIKLNADPTCSTEVMLTAPTGSTPNAPTFVPCTTGTTGIGGN